MNDRIPTRPGRERGFTLIELLVVILIIAVLLAMVFPAITALRRAAAARKATSDCQQIANAVRQYYVVYGRFPAQSTDSSDTTYYKWNQADVITALTNNPRSVLFIEIPGQSFTNGCFVDPWNHPYVITMDYNDDGTSSVSTVVDPMNFGYSPTMSTNVKGTVAVASWGRDPDDDASAADKLRRRIYAWVQ